MNELSDIYFKPLEDSIYMKPCTMHFKLNGIDRTWDLFQVHNSVIIIIYNVSRNVLVFVKQFRPAVYYYTIPTNERNGHIDVKKYPAENGITIELCAGIIDKDLPIAEIAREEVLEECGYDIDISKLERIVSYPTNVGRNGSVQTAFYCEVTDEMKVTQGGGIEDESIEVVEMNVSEAKEYISKDDILSPSSLLYEKRLMEKWLINCGNINLIDLTPVQLYEKRVCASHFSCKHFTNSLKNRLIQGAVPLHYNTKENADKQLNISTETLNLKREAVPKVYKQSRVAEDPIPSAASPLSEINDDSASELNKSPTLLQVVGVCDIFSFGLALYLTQTLYRVSRNEGAKRKSHAIDLKSAVERLYEKLGAVEFNADHEAIYGMERYYTVQQCEELRDEYKIGRKVCRKFLKECLVKRISEIGLRHFLDTINKYIKDCSDSDTSSSSDEEECKAVEQNGEDSKTTEEE
ncbi:hypothetical protein FQA39_LY10826 [Lamprigera yunnana]|nr:hypothetical protein FQA39_LY10826 [Lamprigera yunnana]